LVLSYFLFEDLLRLAFALKAPRRLADGFAAFFTVAMKYLLSCFSAAGVLSTPVIVRFGFAVVDD